MAYKRKEVIGEMKKTLLHDVEFKRKGIGIEIDEDYFNTACKRVEDAYKQPDIFGY